MSPPPPPKCPPVHLWDLDACVNYLLFVDWMLDSHYHDSRIYMALKHVCLLIPACY